MTQLRAVMEAPHIAHAVRVLCAAGHDRDVSRVVLLEAAHDEMLGGVGRLLARAGAASETLNRADVEESSVSDVVATVSDELGIRITARAPAVGELGAQVIVDGTDEAWFTVPATRSSDDV